MAATLNLLCAGAAMGLVKALQPAFEEAHGVELKARFGAVGAMKEALFAGEPCDVMLVTATLVRQLAHEGRFDAASITDLGRVRTGIAVPAGAAMPDIASPAALKAALVAAEAIYFPDPLRATAGIHFAKVMRELGIHDALQPRFHTFPNGATAMRELAQAGRGIGCTQVSEILYTGGITLVDALPSEFELATVYTAAISTQAAAPALAAQFIAAIAGDPLKALRERGGFDA